MKLENIDKSIQKQDILQGISLEVSPQKLTAFIGPNGAGKSTLLSIMSRLTKKDQEFSVSKDVKSRAGIRKNWLKN